MLPFADAASIQTADSSVGSFLHPSQILVVEEETVTREILARKLSSLGYVCRCCPDLYTAMGLLADEKFDLVITDLVASGSGGFKSVKRIAEVAPDTAIILITSVINVEVAVDALKDGAYDYITKPFSLEEVSISVARALEKRRLLLENRKYQMALEEQVASRTSQLQEALKVLHHTYHSTLVALSRALDSRDAGSDGHSLRVTVYAKCIAESLGLGGQQIRVIEQGVLLHDIGKIGIPDELLKKKGNLTERESLLMRRHPEIGYRILSSIKFLKEAAELVYHHHERYDGKGYPQGLSGDRINLGARVFAVADALDDLASASLDSAIREITRMSGMQLDPRIVEAFVKIPVHEWETIRQEYGAGAKRTDFFGAAIP